MVILGRTSSKADDVFNAMHDEKVYNMNIEITLDSRSVTNRKIRLTVRGDELTVNMDGQDRILHPSDSVYITLDIKA